MIVRRPFSSEHALVRGIVQTVVDETFGGLWAEPPLPIDEEDWSLALVAQAGPELAGMTLTHGEWVSDLWVLGRFRGIGVGSALLAAAEAEINRRGHRTGRLRLIESNRKALRFYEGRGWLARRSYPHEDLPVTMIEMAKPLRRAS